MSSLSGNQRETTDHDASYNEIHFAKRCRRTLALQNLEEIAVILLRAGQVALVDRTRDVLANGTAPGAIRVLPG